MRRLYPFIAVLLALLALAWWLAPRGIDGSSQETSWGTPAIGGEFTLTDQHGKRFTHKDMIGRYSLVFFGFTHCPDVCPTGLMTMTAAVNQLSEYHAGQVRPVFITLDPERDTVAEMAEYAKNFHPRLVALTGTPEQVNTAVNSYKVYANKVALPDSALGYTIDHSAYIYLMGPDGRYVTHFDHAGNAQEMAAELTQILENRP